MSKKSVKKVAAPKLATVEAPKARDLKEIEAEYQQLCIASGDRQYRVEVLKSELNQINGRMLAINQEAAAVKAQADAAAQAIAQATGSVKQ